MLITILGQKKVNELEKVMASKFFCSARFAEEIEKLVLLNKDMNYIDAIIHFCDKNVIDVESVPKLIPKPLKEKIKYEASELNFLKADIPCEIADLIPFLATKNPGNFLPLLPFSMKFIKVNHGCIET